MDKNKRSVRCGRCNVLGHNTRTCPLSSHEGSRMIGLEDLVPVQAPSAWPHVTITIVVPQPVVVGFTSGAYRLLGELVAELDAAHALDWPQPRGSIPERFMHAYGERPDDERRLSWALAQMTPHLRDLLLMTATETVRTKGPVPFERLRELASWLGPTGSSVTTRFGVPLDPFRQVGLSVLLSAANQQIHLEASVAAALHEVAEREEAGNGASPSET
jgi:hypothetical protein